MTGDHGAVGEPIHHLRSVTGGYEVPGDGCASYRLPYEGLKAVEVGTHHIVKENPCVFPATVALEAALAHSPPEAA
jgi:regulator of cell morphogenesis and NO signaling